MSSTSVKGQFSPVFLATVDKTTQHCVCVNLVS